MWRRSAFACFSSGFGQLRAVRVRCRRSVPPTWRSCWPLRADDEIDLERQLGEGGHFLPLPKEPAALANVLEVSIVDYILERADQEPGLLATRGVERGYPDIEFSGEALAGEFHAVDVKVARRAASGKTQSRITLYTGNTYFRYPRASVARHVPPLSGLPLPPRRALRSMTGAGVAVAGQQPRADRSGGVADRLASEIIDHPRVPRCRGQHRGAQGRSRRVRDGGGVLPLLAALPVQDRARCSAAARSTPRSARRGRHLAALDLPGEDDTLGEDRMD